jgi:hypothetical protein
MADATYHQEIPNLDASKRGEDSGAYWHSDGAAPHLKEVRPSWIDSPVEEMSRSMWSKKTRSQRKRNEKRKKKTKGTMELTIHLAPSNYTAFVSGGQ